MNKKFLNKQGGFTAPSIRQAGFTLVELMVSLSLFIIVVLALVSSLYSVNDASRKVQSIRTVMDNLNFAIESISRNIKTSTDIVCGGSDSLYDSKNCPLGNSDGEINKSISLHSTLGDVRQIDYRWLKLSDTDSRIEKKSIGINPDGTLDLSDIIDWTRITSPEIVIEDFAFYVDGADQSDDLHPNVIIKIEGLAHGKDGTTVPFAVQTYVSQRASE